MPQKKKQAPHIFKRWKDASTRIGAAKHVRLFLDFDGTLVDICPTPDEVRMTPETRKILTKLTRHPRFTVALLSGRRNAVLRKFVRVPRIQLLGLYGWERNGRAALLPRTRKTLSRLRTVLRELPGEILGIRLEEKGVSFAVHFRGASDDAIRRAKIWMRRRLGFVRPDFRILHSHSTWEIVPREVKGKGAALRDFMKGLRPGFLPIYMGDDLTDEPAFHAVRRGISVRVGGHGPTIAQFRLKDPNEVRQFLERLEKETR